MAGEYWARPVIDRQQMPMFSPTLDEMIAEDHPVRLVDEVLRAVDWSDWEAAYDGARGQPPIHPRIVAGLLLFGLMRGIRSSRRLEDACRHRIDFIWLAEGRTIDHSTFSAFRKQFQKPLRELFGQVVRLAKRIGFVRLIEVAMDGTKVRANSSRYKTATAATLEKILAELEEEWQRALEELEEADRQDEANGSESDQHLPEDLASKAKRKERLEEALKAVQEMDTARKKKRGGAKGSKPAQIPLTDSEARILPNKEGGFAPNYTPMAATDGHSGMLVDVDVINDNSEASVALPALDRIREKLDRYPERAFMDGIYGTGPNLEGLELRNVALLTPAGNAENPARREDPTQPVPEAQWPRLPRNGRGQLDKVCFVYIESKDVYYCPTGQVLQHSKTTSVTREGGRTNYHVYRCASCPGCPLAEQCLSPGRDARTVRRDQHEARRERLEARMATAESKRLYRARMPMAETPFAQIKNAMGVRQFLLRGLDGVKTEWMWISTAFNLNKLVGYLGNLRARLAAAAMIEF